MSKREFSAPIQQAGGGGAFVLVPFDVEAAYGKKRVPVLATIDGLPYRGSLFPMMGGSGHTLGVLKEIRARIGKGIGDIVDVTVEEDTAPREVEVPEDFDAALSAHPSARDFYATLSYSRQREFVLWIESAKREATRQERVAASVAKLAAHEKLR